MDVKAAFMSACLVLGAAMVACTLFAANVAAKEVTVAIHVTTQGLDPRQPAGARKLYSRLQHAAQVACTHGMRVDLKPVTDEDACTEKALAEAIRSVHLPLLTLVYLQTHTLRETAARGIDVPVQTAAK